MLSIGKLASGAAAADYYVRRRAGCELEYYTGDGERPGVWCGRGAASLGLAGQLDDAGEQQLRALLAGRSLTDEELVRPVLRADPRSKVPAVEVLAAVRAVAESRGVEPARLLGDEKLAATFAKATAALERSRRRPTWPAAAIPADVAGRMLSAAGLDPAAALRGPRGRDRFAAAMRRLAGRVDVRVPGLDLCLSAPKSVSVLFGLSDDPTVVRAVRRAHETAVAAAIDYVDRTCAHGLRGHHDGRDARYADTDGLIGSAFEHRTSRAGDPQLHTHVVVANLLHGVDGKWGAVDTRAVFNQARTGGFVYQAVLRGELTRSLGVQWTKVHKGQAEIDGVPRTLLRMFSKRRDAICGELERTGGDGGRAAQRAALVTRPDKPAAQPVALRERWRAEARAAGFDPASLSDVLRQGRPPALPDTAEVTGVLLGRDGLTHKRSTFDRRDVMQAVCEALPPGAPVTLEELRAFATEVVRDPSVVAVLSDVSVRHRRYSTAELLATEEAALQQASARSADNLAVVDPMTVSAVLGRSELSAEQRAMVHQLTESGAGVEVVIGPAGAGKTRALAAAREAWSRAGIVVQGAALAAIAARVLEDGAGIPARSLFRLLAAAERADPRGPAVLPPGGVLVVDEAGMVGTRQLAQLIELTAAHHTKLVLVGDPHQLPEIEAGGLFAALPRVVHAAHLGANQRQRARWERTALAELRDGDVTTALHAYRRHGRLRLDDDRDTLSQRLVEDYMQLRHGDQPRDVLVVTSSRAEARRLNRLLRDALLAGGELGQVELVVPVGESERSYRTGDQVVVTANDYPRALLNGTRGVVHTVHRRDRSVTVRLGDGRDVRLPRSYLERGQLAHGYALTAHKAQGLTVDASLLWGSAALTRETGYVAMSRGREANYLYATLTELRRDSGVDVDHPRTGNTPSERDRQWLARAALVQRLESTGRQRLARSWWRAAREGVAREIG